MPKCRYCHEQISRLDKDICPFCGEKKPFEGGDSSTIDITKAFDPLELQKQHLVPRSKKLAAILCFFFGIFGIDEAYIYRYQRALITVVITIIAIGGLGTLLFFVAMNNFIAFLIPYFALETHFIAKGIFYLTSPTIKDGRGEFLK